MTSGSSCFAEGNYFRDANAPMMSSGQGTDARGSGTFSGEEGGSIKAYNNKFAENNSHNKFQYISNKYDWTNNAELGEYKEITENVGTQSGNEWIIYDAEISDSSDEIAKCSFILVSASNKGSYYQVSKGKVGFVLSVPKNTTKVIVRAKCGSSDQSGNSNMFSVNGIPVEMDLAEDYKDYAVAISGFLEDTTIEIKNVHSKNSLNVKEIKVFASSAWKTTYSVGADFSNIDAYEVSARDETVPETVKTKVGNHIYSNFDTNLGEKGMGISIMPTAPDEAKADVIKYAGRHNSDFAYTFDNSKEDNNADVILELKEKLQNYKSNLTLLQN